MGGKLIRRTSPSTRIIGGSPADKCKSEAPCLAEKASNSVISMVNPNRETTIEQRKRYNISSPRTCDNTTQETLGLTLRSTQVSAGSYAPALPGSLPAVPGQRERPGTI